MNKLCLTVVALLFATNICVVADSSNNLKELEQQLKSKNATDVHTATAELAAHYRQEGELKKAEQLLKKFQNPSGFDRLPPKEAIPYLRCLLETAHLRALNKDVPGSLALLNWAEARKHDYERAISCVKYAEILLDLNEPERADAYLKNANQLINKHLSGDDDLGAAIGQGSQVVDTEASWRNLRDQSDYVAAGVEELQLSKKYGAAYGLYVKLRRLQRIVKRTFKPRYFNEAMRLYDEIIETDPGSQFAQAAGYLRGKILFSAIPDEEGKEQKAAIKAAKQCLEKFIKSDPSGLYRGEAMMLMGKICLEKEWNAKEAEKHYTQALTWFENARTKRDAMSLYAPISDDLKKQTQATQRPTTLNQWRRTVYHDEDPLKLYNTASAPTWYIDDNEKNCLFILGFSKYLNGKYKESGEMWARAGKLDEGIMKLKTLNWPNIGYRLEEVSKHGRMIISDEILKLLKNPKYKFFIQLAEFYYLQENFKEMQELLTQIIAADDATDKEKAVACVAMGMYCDLTITDEKKRTKTTNWFVRGAQLGKGTEIEEYARLRIIYYHKVSTLTENLVEGEMEQYLKDFPDGKYIPELLYRHVFPILVTPKIEPNKKVSVKAISQCNKVLRKLKNKFPKSPYTIQLEKDINNIITNNERCVK